MSLENHLVVFARAPRVGQAKTRLARDMGSVAAWAFARLSLDAVVRPLACDPRWRCWLAVTPDRAARFSRVWPKSHGFVTQGAGDLGRRMAAVSAGLAPGPVVIIGTDVPGIRPHHVARAFKALGGHDFVFGPAGDGGYWLVGMKRRPRFTDPFRGPFRGVRFSTEHALADTLKNLEPGQTHTLLETLEDIDEGEAYRRWKKDGG